MEPKLKRARLDATGDPQLQCVLPEELIRDVPTVEVFVGTINDKKQTRDAILKLNEKHPIPMLQHLKRVHSGRVIVCLAVGVDDVVEFLKKIDFDMSLLCNFERIVVPVKPPVTRVQFEGSRKIWPCNFHEDKYLEKLVNNDFSDEEINVHVKWMRHAVETAQKTSSSVGTVVVEPARNELIAAAGDARHLHPLKHSVMLAVDSVARAQGGGAWDPPATKIAAPQGAKEDLPYLCTGYSVYTTREPCIMCAMALIHSRAKRVFYGTSTSNGGLGTVTKVHSIKSLNHHYEVYKGLLKSDCAKLTH